MSTKKFTEEEEVKAPSNTREGAGRRLTEARAIFRYIPVFGLPNGADT